MSDRATGTLRLDCLGSGNAFSHGQYWSGFLLDGRILLDCPPQTLAHLHKLDVTVDALDLVLLTHQHADHILGMDLLLLEATAGESRRQDSSTRIVGPPGIYDRVRGIVGGSSRLPDRSDVRLPWSEQAGETRIDVRVADGGGDIGIECVEVDHVPQFTSLGYRIRVGGKLVAYTGDTKICDAVYELADGADLLIAECGGGPPHMDWPDIFALREALPTSTAMLITHYDRRRAPNVSAIDGLTLAEDFASYEV